MEYKLQNGIFVKRYGYINFEQLNAKQTEKWSRCNFTSLPGHIQLLKPIGF